MEKIWFISVNDIVKGPLTTDAAEAEISRMGGSAQALVWWKGYSHWVAVHEWRKNREQILKDIAAAQGEAQLYYIDLGDEPKGPFSVLQLGQLLEPVKDMDRVRIWSSEKKHWVSIFDLPHICDRLAITRRSHPRVPMSGVAELVKDDFEAQVPVQTVSMGGFGIKFDPPLVLTGIVSIKLRSPALFNVIKTRAEVVYCKDDGSVGFKFLNLSTENQAAIVEYVRAFTTAAVSEAA